MKLYYLTFMIISFVIILTLAYFNELTQIFTISSTMPKSRKSTSYARQLNLKHNFIDRYPSLLECNLKKYPKLTIKELNNYENLTQIHSQEAPKWTYNMRLTRGLIINFPIDSLHVFRLEFKWLYRSWIEMQKSESKYWRTDLIVFISKNNYHLKSLKRHKNSNLHFLLFFKCNFNEIGSLLHGPQHTTFCSETPAGRSKFGYKFKS
jgi:hypothetical protein